MRILDTYNSTKHGAKTVKRHLDFAYDYTTLSAIIMTYKLFKFIIFGTFKIFYLLFREFYLILFEIKEEKKEKESKNGN